MVNVILILLLAAVFAIGFVSSFRHFRGQGGCCGGGGYRPRKKKLSNVIGRKCFTVEGMHCEHCKTRVEEAVNDIHGVAGQVELKKGELTVSYAEPVEDETIKARIERVGYRVTGIVEL